MYFRPVRTSQPQGPARVDWSNPITQGLVDVISGVEPGAFINQDDAQRASTPQGLALKGNGGSSYFYKNTAPSGLNLSGNITLFAVANGEMSGTDRRLYAFGSSASNNPILAIACGDADASKLRCFTRDLAGANGGTNSSIAVAFEVGKPHYLSLRIGSTLDLFVDGKAEAQQSRPAFSATTFNRTSVGCLLRTTASSFASSALLLGLAFNRALSDAEIKSLSANPWQIFAPDSKALWTPAAVSVTLPTLVQPSSTTSAGAWTATGAATLHDAINELVPSDTQYISVNSASTTELLLAEAAYPGASNQTLAYRASSTQGSTLTVTLKQGATQIMTRTHALTGVDTLYTQTLTAGEIASIIAGPISVTLTTS